MQAQSDNSGAMFFILSKIFWVLMQPLNILCALGLTGLALRYKFPEFGQKLMNFAIMTIILLGIFPIGILMMTWLERQHPTPQNLPAHIDGIILLGGPFEAAQTINTGHLVVNDQIDRALCFLDVAKKNPSAKLVFSGGAGDILNPDANESVDAKTFFNLTGLNHKKIIFEDKSKNTYENIVFSKALVKPSANEKWVVTTSAYHMPRTVNIFKKAGWDIIPYQCDLRTNGAYTDAFYRLPNIAGNFGMMNLALKEIFGLVIYYATGKSTFLITPSKVVLQQ